MNYSKNTQCTTRSANPYMDNYTGFVWNNLHSSVYNCFIENTGHLVFNPAPTFSNAFVTPIFQERTYYTGMQQQTKQFQLDLVFYQITLQQLNEALRWLDCTIVSDFFYDYEPYWKYACKLASLGTMEKYVNGAIWDASTRKRRDLYLCRIPVTFETVYHTDALSTYTLFKDFDFTNPTNKTFDYSNNDYFDIADADDLIMCWQNASEDYTVTIQNPTQRPLYFKLHFYDVTTDVRVYQKLVGNGIADALSVDDLLLQCTLNLDDGCKIHLHYNSEDGTLITANNLVANLRGVDGHNICQYAMSQSNVGIAPQSSITLNIQDSSHFAIECDLKNYII